MTKKNNLKKKTSGLTSRITQVFMEHNVFLKKFLTRFLDREQDIEDVMQETYLKAYRYEKDGTIKQPKAFLFTIAKNIAITELNRKSQRMTTYIEECQAPFVMVSENNTENEIEAKQTLAIYCDAVAALPEKSRRVYMLRKVYGLRHKEIAKQLGMSISSVEKHLRDGTAIFRDHVRKNSGEYQGHGDSISTHRRALKEGLK
jgi:RNA polymerase sigma factor (sigma-70 family)